MGPEPLPRPREVPHLSTALPVEERPGRAPVAAPLRPATRRVVAAPFGHAPPAPPAPAPHGVASTHEAPPAGPAHADERLAEGAVPDVGSIPGCGLGAPGPGPAPSPSSPGPTTYPRRIRTVCTPSSEAPFLEQRPPERWNGGGVEEGTVGGFLTVGGIGSNSRKTSGKMVVMREGSPFMLPEKNKEPKKPSNPGYNPAPGGYTGDMNRDGEDLDIVCLKREFYVCS